MLSANEIVQLQDGLTVDGHGAPEAEQTAFAPPLIDLEAELTETHWRNAVSWQHRANFALWHIEDLARQPQATDARLAEVKRQVDRTNQRRNDLAETLDRLLLGWLEVLHLPVASAPLHSETPGLIIDRLSILSLKIYHTRLEAERVEAGAEHRARNLTRLSILEEQRSDLATCLDELWRQTVTGTRRFKLYQQLKMYNDPTLNPAIYAANGAAH